MHSKWHQTFDFWQLLGLTSSGLLISILEKLRLVSFDWSGNSIAMDVKMDGSALEKKKKNHLSRCWDCLCYLNSTGALMLSLLLKVPPRKMELWFVLWNVFLLRLLFIYINEPYNLVWNNVVMSGLVLLGAIWIFWISYRNRYVGLLFFHLLLSWTVGSSSKFSQLKSFL